MTYGARIATQLATANFPFTHHKGQEGCYVKNPFMKHGGGLQLEVYIRSVIAALRHPWHANLRSFPKVYSFLVFFSSAIALATAHGESIDMMELGESFPLQPTPIPVKMQFITQKVQQYFGDTLIKYHAALCGGCQFDGHTARFAINLVNSRWDDDLGDTITVTTKDSAGHIVATNLVGNSLPVPDFNFSYHVK